MKLSAAIMRNAERECLARLALIDNDTDNELLHLIQLVRKLMELGLVKEFDPNSTFIN